MTLHQQCLPGPTPASDYAALLAALPDDSSGKSCLLGGWLLTFEIKGEKPEDVDAVFIPGGQYLETGEQGSLERLCFGTWHISDSESGAFEVTSQKLVFEGTQCVGWVQTLYSGLPGEPGSYTGIGHLSEYNLLGEEQGTVAVTVKASRPNPFPAEALR